MSIYRYYRFTLLELLIVIGIIMILASLLLPSLSNCRELSRRIGCLNNLKQIALGILQYAEDNKGDGPDNIYGYTGATFYAVNSNSILMPYLNPSNSQSNFCPVVECPSVKPPFKNHPLYGAGLVKTGTIYSAYILAFGYSSGTSTALPYQNLNQLSRRTVGANYFGSPSRQPLAGDVGTKYQMIMVYGLSSGNVPACHNGSNTVFFDGSARWTARQKYSKQILFYYSTKGSLYWD